MIRIPGGEIALRDDRINLSWKVIIHPFLLGKYLITQDIYFNITGKEPFAHKGNRKPAENVSWFDAVCFCNLLSQKSGFTEYYIMHGDSEEIICRPESQGYRLPSEAEWQYACQAGVVNPRYGDINDISWYKENSRGATHEVGKKEPNAWGLYDMLGNVWEWCWDIYDEKEYGSYRVIRGGGWNDPERGCLATNRRRSHPSFKIDDLGFRIASSGKLPMTGELFEF